MDAELPKTSWRQSAPFRLGDWEVLPASGELRGRRGTERLRPLLMDILQRLASQPGEVVRRETLLEDVWTRRMVNDEVLSRAIAELRTVLGDDAREARYIETLPKIGYRLVATVTRPQAAEPAPLAAAPVAAAPAAPATAPAAMAARRRLPAWTWITAGIVVALAGSTAAWLATHRGPPADQDIERRLNLARPFTSDPAMELAPRFSPTGDRVAFALGEGSEARIVVQAIDGSSRQFIGKAGYVHTSPIFFPDGNRVAFWRGKAPRECAIVEHDLASGRERDLLDCTHGPRPRFDLSRDGRFIAFSANTRPQFPAGLWIAEIDKPTPRILTTPQPGSGDDLWPRFSPDGKRIAFFRGNESHRQPWVVEREDGASARRLANVEGLAYGLAWMGEDGPLLAAADWFGFRSLNVVDPASGKARMVGARGARFPDVGPRGEITWENAVYSANIFRVDTAGTKTEPVMLWRSTRYSNQPEFSPDGKSVLFSSNRDGSDAIYVAALDGEARRIAFGEAHRYLRPHWSADGRYVLALRNTTDATGAAVQEGVRIPVAGGPAEVLTALGKRVTDVRETRDGGWLLWGETVDHAMRLMRAPVSDLAKAERLPWPVMTHYQVNAERIVFAQPQLRRLTSCRLDTLACEPLDVEVYEIDLYHWTLGSRSLFVRVREGAGARIERRDLATGKVTGSFDVIASGAGTSIAVSPDENILLAVKEEGPAIDLMLAR